MKWVIGAAIGGIASAVTGFWLERISNKNQQAAAEPVQKAGLFPGGTQPAANNPGVSIPPELLDRLRPPAAPPLAPATPPRPAAGVRRPSQPVLEPVTPFTRAATPPAASDFPGLLAYWSLDEGKGANAFDSAAKAQAVLNGGRWVSGVRGQAVELDGTAFVGLGESPRLNFPAQSAFTIACWVRPASDTGKVFWFRNHPDGLAIVGVHLDGGKLRGWVRHDGGVFHPNSFGGEVAAPHPLRTGEWYHVALVRHANGQPEMYQDGRSLGRAKGGRETTGKVTTNTRTLGVDAHALLQNPNHSEAQPLQGALDEFCVFNRALSAVEVAKLAGREP